MKKIQLSTILTLISIVLSSTLYAQSMSQVRGKIVDESTQIGIEGAMILILKNGSIVNDTFTEENGEFRFEISEGEYEIITEIFSYVKNKQSIHISGESVNLESIKMEKITKEHTLTNLVITGKKTTIKNSIDRKVVTLGDDWAGTAPDLTQILTTIPGISIDQANQISLRGSLNVKVLIDGKPSTLDFDQVLKLYPPYLVDKIEILTNPPAKYSPEGKAGIINIILKKSTKQGINLGLNTGYIIGKKSKYVNGIDMNLGYKKFNLFANAGYNDYNFQNSGYLKRRNPDSQLDYLLSIGNINRYVKVGTDYFINSQNTLSVYTQQSGNNLRVDNESIDSNNLMKSIINQSQKDNSKYQEYDLFYKSKFDKSDHELEFQANFNKNNQDRFRNSSISLKERNHIEEKNIRANLDYSNPLSDKTMFTAGAELRLNRYNDNYESAQANVYKFERDIYSLYAEYKKQWERIGLKAGIRGELTDTKATSDFTNSVQVNTTDVQIYPTLHTSYKLGKGKKMELSFNYSRRIDRPWAGILSPVPQFVVGTIIISGNDKLKPEFTNSFQVGTSANIGKLNVEAGIFYRDIKDAISQRFVEHPSYIEIINENTKANAQYGGEFDLNFSAYKWWKNNSSLEYYWGEVSGLKQEQWTKRNIDKYIIKTTNNFVLNPSLSIQLLAQYYSKSKDLYNSYNEQWKVDISLRKMLMNNQLSISIRLADVFNTNHSEYQMINPSNLKGRSDWESRNISFSVRYNLSSGKVNRINKKVFDENTKKGGGIM